MLAERTGNILDIIVGEYISMARPVGSEAIVERHGLGVSSATVRNEVVRLEEEGYIIRPHISGGAIPSDKGYRHYVESVVREAEEIPLDEQRMLSHLFHQVEQELSEWTHLAASLLARMVCSVAIVTSPKALSCRIKHLELVALQESLALVILLLQEARLKQQLIAFDEVVPQEELSAISGKLGTLFHGLTVAQLLAQDAGLSPIEQHIKNAVVQVMADEDRRRYEEPYIEGLRHILTQPEFTHAQNILCLVEMLESRDMVRSLFPEMVVDGGVRIVIGAENREGAMKGCSMVFTQYGVPGEVNGALGVIGPTRMPYGRAISSVRYVGSLLSELVAELYIGPERQ
jgi:heat-inducible transcriptional repressor